MAAHTPVAFEQDTELCAGSIIACLAPNDMFWLAQTCAPVGVEDVRWQVRWLEELKTNKQKNASITYRLLQSWDDSTIWRDCVLADMTNFVKEDSKGGWAIDVATSESLLQLAKQSQCPKQSTASQAKPNTNTVCHSSTDSGFGGGMEQPSDNIVSSFVNLCKDAIYLV